MSISVSLSQKTSIGISSVKMMIVKILPKMIYIGITSNLVDVSIPSVKMLRIYEYINENDA
jgi:hypothetical protein